MTPEDLGKAGLFEDGVSLAPVSVWWQEMRSRERTTEAVRLLNRLLPEDVRLQESINSDSEFLFIVRGTPLPFPALSDGYRAFVGWIADLLLQMAHVTPPTHRLTDLCGVVIVDELDLLLHPAWQRVVIEQLATTFPRLQFFFTSHSPDLE